MAPVANCLQYHTAQYGTIASFGWDLTYQNALYSLSFLLVGTQARQQCRRRRPTWWTSTTTSASGERGATARSVTPQPSSPPPQGRAPPTVWALEVMRWLRRVQSDLSARESPKREGPRPTQELGTAFTWQLWDLKFFPSFYFQVWRLPRDRQHAAESGYLSDLLWKCFQVKNSIRIYPIYDISWYEISTWCPLKNCKI